ncbi:pentapeptide repeat-containing protein [Flavitalea sp. BT771]|uniref:pentapeptide repeat-containing protein n=1 Tax=Flavitalea sp. BT771 TaxID=3063329 RepID=UPI0026E2543F|nr:pentapeptide repeat-containing protein [Flavitalea sp. BT771]MDO6431511.1 pentapeptide repeat-containing protein [Flavitalea sp. BT771]MDV6220419.1 pentapeptide repeat-containing protein [Flavitalea sp. BT771]
MEYTDESFDKKDFTCEPLQKGTYENCIFRHCNFSSSDLSSVRFIDCAFNACNLSLARLDKTVFRDVQFKGCKMVGLHFEQCDPFGLSFGFEGGQLDQSSFYRNKLKKTIFKGIQLRETDFTECDLTNAVFDHCDLAGATFENTILEKADLRTSFNYSIDPERNKVKKAKFSLQGLPGLLNKYDIEIQ